MMNKKMIMGISFGIIMAIIAVSIGALAGMKISSFIPIDNEIASFIVKGFIYFAAISLSLKLFSMMMLIMKMKKV